jgi:hypothetical protein
MIMAMLVVCGSLALFLPPEPGQTAILSTMAGGVFALFVLSMLVFFAWSMWTTSKLRSFVTILDSDSVRVECDGEIQWELPWHAYGGIRFVNPGCSAAAHSHTRCVEALDQQERSVGMMLLSISRIEGARAFSELRRRTPPDGFLPDPALPQPKFRAKAWRCWLLVFAGAGLLTWGGLLSVHGIRAVRDVQTYNSLDPALRESTFAFLWGGGMLVTGLALMVFGAMGFGYLAAKKRPPKPRATTTERQLSDFLLDHDRYVHREQLQKKIDELRPSGLVILWTCFPIFFGALVGAIVAVDDAPTRWAFLFCMVFPGSLAFLGVPSLKAWYRLKDNVEATLQIEGSYLLVGGKRYPLESKRISRIPCSAPEVGGYLERYGVDGEYIWIDTRFLEEEPG